MSDPLPNERAWSEIRARLVRYIGSRVEDRATAEDITQDVLLKAYRKRHALRDGSKFESWLYQITRNAVIDHYRSRRPHHGIPAALPEAEDEIPSVLAELAECMQPLISSLPPAHREALRLSELQGFTQRATARELGLSHSGAKSRVQRARRMLKKKLLECCRLEFDARGTIVDFEARDRFSEPQPRA